MNYKYILLYNYLLTKMYNYNTHTCTLFSALQCKTN